MSEAVLAIGLCATFLAIASGTLAVSYVRRDRHRAQELLRQQVKASSLDLRQRQMATPFLSRIGTPVTEGLSSLVHRFTPDDLRARLSHKLDLAGNPKGWTVEKVISLKIVGGVSALVLGPSMSRLGELGGMGALVTLLMVVIGFFGPDAIISGRADRRQTEIQRSLPDVMDLLSISVEAGLAFNAALAHVMTTIPGALSEEIARVLRQMRLGATRLDAMRTLGERSSVSEMKSFVLSMVQAETFGVSISGVLRTQASELRDKRRQRAEEKAMKIPVKILFPMIFCIMPALFVVIIGPGAIKIFEEFIGLVR